MAQLSDHTARTLGKRSRKMPALLFLVVIAVAVYTLNSALNFHRSNPLLSTTNLQLKANINTMATFVDAFEKNSNALDLVNMAQERETLLKNLITSMSTSIKESSNLAELLTCPREKTFYKALLTTQAIVTFDANHVLAHLLNGEEYSPQDHQSIINSLNRMMTSAYRLQVAVHRRQYINQHLICADEEPR